MNPESINPETLDKIIEAAKVGGFVIVASVLGLAATFAGVYTAVKLAESNFADQVHRYQSDLYKYRMGELKEKPRFRDYKIK